MALILDLGAYASIPGICEYGGTFDGTPPLNQRLTQAASYAPFVPPNGCTLMQRVICAPGDVYGTTLPGSGWRTMVRQGNPIPTRTRGFESWNVIAHLCPTGFPSDANMYVSPWEVHQTGSDSGVTPHHIIFNGATGTFIDLWGGPTDASGGLGNPGRILQYSHNFTTITQLNVWHVWVIHLKYGIQNVSGGGTFEVFYGRAGTDLTVTSLTGLLTNVYTQFGTRNMYPLVGLYRGQSGSSTTTLYTAGWREYSTQAEALQWANFMLGTVVDPPPDPPGEVQPYYGNWTLASLVDSTTAPPDPSSFGPWTLAEIVHPYNPGPDVEYKTNWTIGSLVGSSETFPYVASVIAAGPNLYWRLDEAVPGTGSTFDSSVGSNDGTYVASPSSAPSLIADDDDPSVVFNGTTQWVTSTYAPFTTSSQRTIECWAKRTSTANEDVIWGSSSVANCPVLRFNSGANTISFFSDLAQTGTTWTGPFAAATIFHIVLTFDSLSKSATLWVNGVSQGSRTMTTGYNATPGNFTIARRGTNSGPFDGTLDEVAVYESLLSGQEILAHYNLGADLGGGTGAVQTHPAGRGLGRWG